MDSLQTLPELYKLLSNPVTFGALISWACEQLAFFKDENRSPIMKLMAVIGICQVWSVGMFVLNSDGQLFTVANLREIVYVGLAVAVSTQAVHLFINKIWPGFTGFLLSLRSTTTRATSISTGAEGTNTSVSEVKSGPPKKAAPDGQTPEPEIKLPSTPDPPSMQSATEPLTRARQDD